MSGGRGGLRAPIIALMLAGVCLTAVDGGATAQAPDPAHGAWATGLELGAGRLRLSTDQGRAVRATTFVMGFRGSRVVNVRLRVGIDIGGWLIESNDVNDPAEGESVSMASGHVQYFPLRKRPLYLEGGVGHAVYTNHRPLEFGTRGLGWSGGIGYAVAPSPSAWWSISAHASGGGLRDVENLVVTETGWRWSAVDLRLGGGFRFGAHEQ